MVPFSNPRRTAEFADWPSDPHRVRCTFTVETHPTRGKRVARVTWDRHGRPCKPKHTTYAGDWVIVDGADGRTYLLAWSDRYQTSVAVTASDCQHNATVAPLTGHYFTAIDPEYPELRALFATSEIPTASV